MSPFEELCRVFKIKPKPGETLDEFAPLALKKISKTTDAQWGELSEELQLWNNQTMKALEEKSELPELVGFPAEEDASKDGPVDDEGANDNAEHDPETGEVAEEAVDEGDAEGQDTASSEKTEEDEPPVSKKGVRKATAKETKEKPKPTKEKKMSTAAAKAPKAAPVAKKATAPKTSARRGVADTATIKVLAKSNPYREGTLGYKVFAKYRDGDTVKAFVSKAKAVSEARTPVSMLRFDERKGHVKVVNAKA